MKRTTPILALSAAGALVLAACSDENTTTPTAATTETNATDAGGDVSTGEAEMEVIATGLEAPWSVAFFGDTPLISERDSHRILILDDDGETSELTTIDGVDGGSEGGLLGLATDDDYLYVYYTAGIDGDGENRIERFPVEGSGTDLEVGDPEVILEEIPAATTHNGGRIAFGPDGMLYASTGDANITPNSQDPDSLAGKILRMTPEGEVPEDNPFEDSLVYSSGHRNVQGMAWAEDGTMWASEFGANDWDELNEIEPGGNYGWPAVEGMGDPDDDEYINPVQAWQTAVASPSGITIVGDNIYVANLRGSRLMQIPLSDPQSRTDYFVDELGRIRDVVEAPDGSLWILTNNTDGRGSPAAEDDRLIKVELQ